MLKTVKIVSTISGPNQNTTATAQANEISGAKMMNSPSDRRSITQFCCMCAEAEALRLADVMLESSRPIPSLGASTMIAPLRRDS